MTFHAVRNAAAAIFAGWFLPGCAAFKPKPPPPPPGPKPAYVWDAEKAKTVADPASVVINLGEQRVYFYKGDALIGETKCSTGKKGFETPAGEYKITQKNKNHVSNLYGKFVDEFGEVVDSDVDTSKMKVPEGCTFIGAKMPFYMRFHGGYGMHAGYVPARRASHGCVRLPRVMAERFFGHVGLGTPVTVVAPPPPPPMTVAKTGGIGKKKGG
jgi:lipoprotein-anchoring transpeptidase ErfK/SrfK